MGSLRLVMMRDSPLTGSWRSFILIVVKLLNEIYPLTLLRTQYLVSCGGRLCFYSFCITRTFHSLNSSSASPLPRADGRRGSTLYSLLFDYFRYLAERNLAVFILLWLAYLIQYNVLQVHPSCCTWQNFLLFLRLNNNIPLYVYTTFFMHLFNWLFLYLVLLRIVLKRTWERRWCFETLISIFSGWIPRSGIARPLGSFTLNFYDPPYCFLPWL